MDMNENTELTTSLNLPPERQILFVSTSSNQIRYTEETLINLITLVHELRNEVKNLMIKKVVEDEQLPTEIVTAAVYNHMKKNHKLGRPPMEGEIKDAISKTRTMYQAADYIGISVYTLKRYCRLYENVRSGGTPLWKPTRGKKPSLE